MPNVLYLFGCHSHGVVVEDDSNNKNKNNNNSAQHQVLVEGRRRKTIGRGFFKRYPHVEELLVDSLHVLVSDNSSKVKYPRLSHHIMVTDDQQQQQQQQASASSTFTGCVPLILNLGDTRDCQKLKT
jgi:hypothetical protein